MKLYKFSMKSLGSFSAQLQSDTLFGAFCWSFRYRFGGEKLLEMLEECWEGRPPVIFSNGFPQGTLPLPLGIYDEDMGMEKIEEKTQRQLQYSVNKNLKKARFVNVNTFNQIIQGNHNGFVSGIKSDLSVKKANIHNMVSRDFETVRNIDGAGSLFETTETFAGDQLFDVYVLANIDEKILKETLDLMVMLGIGANKSTGKGQFEILDFAEDVGIVFPKEPNAFVALSNFIPAKNDPIKGNYKTFVKFGKLDREFAGTEQPFKKPLLFLNSGATFKANQISAFYGQSIRNVSPQNSDITTNAYTIAIPMVLNS